MSTLGRIISWIAVIAVAALVLLLVVGAFLGADAARAMFNSLPLIGLWGLLLVLLVTAPAHAGKAARRPALIATHVGGILILAGGMWGSQRGHEITGRVLQPPKARRGCIAASIGEASSRLLDARLERVIGRLPFMVALAGCRSEHDPSDAAHWALGYGRFPPGGSSPQATPLPVGREVEIPGTPLRVKALAYLGSARPIFAEDAAARLEIVQPGGFRTILPAKEGETARLDSLGAELRIVRILPSAFLCTEDGRRCPVPVPGGEGRPAVEVQITYADHTSRTRYIAELLPLRPAGYGGPILSMLPPEPIGVEPGDGPPAMELLISAAGVQERKWLFPLFHQRPVGRFLGLDEDPFGVVLVAAGQRTGECASKILVLKDGEIEARAVLAPNHPLHYGGYHIYHNSPASWSGESGILTVVSDSGLWMFYLGAGLVWLGVAWWCWGRPLLVRLIARRKAHGG